MTMEITNFDSLISSVSLNLMVGNPRKPSAIGFSANSTNTEPYIYIEEKGTAHDKKPLHKSFEILIRAP